VLQCPSTSTLYECSGHGSCVSTYNDDDASQDDDGTLSCQCDQGWMGSSDCSVPESCVVRYHHVTGSVFPLYGHNTRVSSPRRVSCLVCGRTRRRVTMLLAAGSASAAQTGVSRSAGLACFLLCFALRARVCACVDSTISVLCQSGLSMQQGSHWHVLRGGAFNVLIWRWRDALQRSWHLPWRGSCGMRLVCVLCWSTDKIVTPCFSLCRPFPFARLPVLGCNVFVSGVHRPSMNLTTGSRRGLLRVLCGVVITSEPGGWPAVFCRRHGSRRINLSRVHARIWRASCPSLLFVVELGGV